MPGPDVGGGDHQAGVVGGLQRELDPPGIGLRRGGLGQPEAGTHRAGGYLGAVPPRVQFGGQLGQLAPEASSCGVATSRRASVVVRASDESFGHRKAGRGPAPPRRAAAEPGSRARAAASASASRAPASNGPGELAAGRPAGRGHRRRQVVGPLRVGAAEHGAPPGGVGRRPRRRARAAPGRARPGRRRSGPPRPGRAATRPRPPPRRPAGRKPPSTVERGRGARRRAPAPASGQRHPTAPGRPRSTGRPGLRQPSRRSTASPAGPPGEGGRLCRVSSSWTALRAASPTAWAGSWVPGRPASRSASSAAWQGERMGSGQPDAMRRGPRNGDQIRVLGPQAERAVRPDPVNNPHGRTPDYASAQHANSDLARIRRETPTAAYLGVSWSGLFRPERDCPAGPGSG